MQFYKPFFVLCSVISLSVIAQDSDAPATLEAPTVEPSLQEVIEKISAENTVKSKQVVPISTERPTVNQPLKNIITEIVQDNANQISLQEAIASETLNNAQDNAKLNSDDVQRALAAPDYGKFGTGGEYGDESAMSEAMAHAERQAITNKDTRYGDDVYAYIAVSMSMPQQWFRNMLASLANEHKDKRVVLALQGAKPGEFARLALALEQTMPEENEGSYAIVIDPTIFMRLGVTKVPMFAINTEKGWRKVLGELSLTQATAYAVQDYDVFEALGRTYDIEEPNMITLLQKKMAEQFENDDPVQAMRDQAVKSKKAIVNLPYSEKTYSYRITPIYTVEQDLAFEGTVFARKGDTVNTLEHMPLKDAYVFIDLAEPSHVALARQWLSTHPNLRLFSTTLPRAEVLGEFINEFGYISQINQLMVDRFGIEAIPSMALQVENQLQINVEKHAVHTSEEGHYAAK